MKKKNSLLFVFAMMLFVTSCNKERIIPAQEKRSPIEQQRQEAQNAQIQESCRSEGCDISSANQDGDILTMRGSYHIDSFEVNKPVDGGPQVIENIGNLIAGFIVGIGGNFDVDVDPIPVDLSDTDLDLVKVAKVKTIYIEVISDKSKAKLNFLKKLKLKLVNPTDNSKVELISTKYRKHPVCGDRCLEIPVNDVNLMDFVEDTREIILIPEVSIGKTPKTNFKVKVSVDFELGVTMPF